uniref:Uncharacterized protein n=1 Tax=Peronospora matthiolae TaxID=2874970 RepID=A0AAV1UCE5_9STRA
MADSDGPRASCIIAAAGAAGKEHNVDDDSKKAKEWWDDRDGDIAGEAMDGDVPGVDTAVAGVDSVAAGDGRRHTSATPSPR